MLRLLLLFALIFTLVPSAGEAVEMVVHRAVEGHWAHSAQHHDDQPGSGEHGCSPTAHLCHCCPSQAIERHQQEALVVVRRLVSPIPPLPVGAPAADALLEPPFRPPIAA